MPEYLYRREDGTTFAVRQKFSDDPLTNDPETGQKVVRVIQPTGVIFKGSGFYVNDSKNASKKNLSTTTNGTDATSASTSDTTSSETKSESKSETKADTKSETKSTTSDSAAS